MLASNQLLGHIDMDTREWIDGVLTKSARQVVKESQGIFACFQMLVFHLEDVFVLAEYYSY